ncbi:universal stress protein [Liquorilactobacillus satsumensis]|nr:universal stress protein [Liquorilactobacillus satsumensis]MCC7667359.1 universal stress protein [Liquorilactobacillus satsumensis]MCP9313218.1 universal stress protein [Liquorilactobacillus satsumensis]MCP9329470.1 universal stress protein [Liquorilactobacillus satsumensis]MCP9358201.1 universal stress protein [Liquorilactobacillus satsumensis]MCP9360421.1 universal stress protein [Liquorilactobacillus satsumensis]
MAIDEKALDFEISEKPFKRILVAVDEDDSDSSIRAFQFAVTMAKRNQAVLGIVSVLELQDLNVFETLSPEKINKLRQNLANDVNVYARQAQKHGVAEIVQLTAEGRPGAAIIGEVIPEFKPDILICGSKSKPVNSRQRIFIGSQASYMAQNAPCSVLVIRK